MNRIPHPRRTVAAIAIVVASATALAASRQVRDADARGVRSILIPVGGFAIVMG